eukprot:jgi/Chrzof1/7430/Cz02g23120.t1
MAKLLYHTAGAAAGIVEGCLYIASQQLTWLWATSTAVQAKASLEAALEECAQQLEAALAAKHQAQAEAADLRCQLHGALLGVAAVGSRIEQAEDQVAALTDIKDSLCMEKSVLLSQLEYNRIGMQLLSEEFSAMYDYKALKEENRLLKEEREALVDRVSHLEDAYMIEQQGTKVLEQEVNGLRASLHLKQTELLTTQAQLEEARQQQKIVFDRRPLPTQPRSGPPASTVTAATTATATAAAAACLNLGVKVRSGVPNSKATYHNKQPRSAVDVINQHIRK